MNKMLSVTVWALTHLISYGLQMSTMVYRVVSTKLTEEEHSRLLDICNIMGCTPSYLMKDMIMQRIELEQKTIQKEPKQQHILSKELSKNPQQEKKELPSAELAKLLGIKMN